MRTDHDNVNHSDLAQQVLKDPYNFNFLTLRQDAHEREIETALPDKFRNNLPDIASLEATLSDIAESDSE